MRMGLYLYTPTTNFTGFDSFQFDATDAMGNVSEPATATIDVTATTTPLPAALPLFATGLGALGLLGWRRKRKSQAAA